VKQNYYLWINDQESGPFTAADVTAMVNDGEISIATLARKSQNADWDGLETFMPEIQRTINWRKEAENIRKQAHKDVLIPRTADDAPTGEPYVSDVRPAVLRAAGMFVMLVGFLGVGVTCAGLPVLVDGVTDPERLNLRLCLVIAGGALFLAGVAMMATAYIVGHMQNLKG